MTARYIPEIGDVVEYNGNRMTIVRIKNYETYNIAYLASYQFIQTSAPITIRTEELVALCEPTKYEPGSPESIPFTKIDTLPIKIREESYIKIQ